MSKQYRIDPNFEVPEPTAATFHCHVSEAEFTDKFRDDLFDHWKAEGVKQARCTLVNDEYPHPPYPHGVWIEGWTDANARMLPFGEAESPDGPIYPPLVSNEGKLRSAA